MYHKRVDPLQQGLDYLAQLNAGQSVAQIAAQAHVHRSTVENGLRLARAPEAVIGMIVAGQVAAHTALKVLRASSSPEEAVAKLHTAMDGNARVTGKHLAPPKRDASPLRPIVTALAAMDPMLTPKRDVVAALILDARAALEVAK